MTAPAAPRFHSLYQGVVESNEDPLQQGRLYVRVPDVLGDVTVWASPLTPLAGTGSGMYVVPLVRSGVWVQFLEGDPGRPVWVGFWRDGPQDVPLAAAATPAGTAQVVLSTPQQNALVLSDAPTGGVKLQFGPVGPSITIDATGIELTCGPGQASITLRGPLVSINGEALTVLV
ncbi:phage baseplate assembly protein V [Streptomyces sp. XH2]|uniref:phage baseplate assembly protein V n=1 Tax=Streptomyces sp. XH2 TaxID=3412483 RepID=UPI003C7C9DF8